ncbi:hypothetical protein E4191_18350 (plasmid) [Paracoccus liaowanqingii]|uniref:Heat induced stress protein YflT n=1 Tax=Paracoccus liaowanqingii TaxID=2560053 RepID=A0A4Y5SRG0_9RHOB|nr:hypothetical protein [Paracoccus liaowanqingii]QDA36087.1 hypothetical protein E4191_18350 [Paracoccus liaowanqingii]
MYRNVTTIYRAFATADLVRQELIDLGITSDNIHVIPDQDDLVGADGTRSNQKYSDQLHDLHLPEDDLRTYQQSVRQGDYVVSVEVDEDRLVHVQDIMRRPEQEAHNLGQRSSEFQDASIDPYSDPQMDRNNSEILAKRDVDHDDPYSRSYTRSNRLAKKPR